VLTHMQGSRRMTSARDPVDQERYLVGGMMIEMMSFGNTAKERRSPEPALSGPRTRLSTYEPKRQRVQTTQARYRITVRCSLGGVKTHVGNDSPLPVSFYVHRSARN
jgi:hypothetical protein